jgi:replicative DNA helicase
MGEVIIAKHRNGRTDTVQLKFIGKLTKFSALDAGMPGDYGNSFPDRPDNSDFTITLPSKGNASEDTDEETPF